MFEKDYSKSPSKTKNSKKRTDAEKIKAENFQLLNEYLRKNNLSLSKKECRAILFAMNGMTIYYQTKPQAIDKTSKTFHVTKKFIKQHLNELGIVSQRAVQAKRDFGRVQGVAMGLLKRKMAEEEE